MGFLLRTSTCLPAFFVFVSTALSQEEPGERARFVSRDGVDLHGHYYAGRGRSAPCVLLVHDLGESSRKGPWKDLAKALHAKGMAVLSFDLRGHGYSTTVDPAEFWLPRYHNRALIRGKQGEEIDFANFDQRYYPYLANDLAAARAFLDRKNDLGECNASNVVVIAAGQGATLAALWINSEWHRFQVLPPSFIGMRPRLNKDSEGTTLLAAVLLSPQPKLGGRRVNLPALLDLAGRQGKMPLTLLHGADDEEGERLAKAVVKSLEGDDDLEFTGAVAVPHSKRLEGADLLAPRFAMDKQIIEWIETVKDKNAREWLEREAGKRAFIWKAPHNFNVWLPAMQPGDQAPVIETYERFIR